MKKIIIGTLLILIFVSSSVASANNSNNIAGKDFIRYQQLGFTENEINNFTQEEIEHFKGISGHVISSETTYYRVTEDENKAIHKVEISKETAIHEVAQFNARKAIKNNSYMQLLVGGSDTETTSWMTMTTTVSEISGTSPKEHLLKNSFTWLTNPFWRLTDVFAISHPESIVHVQNSEIASYSFRKWNSMNTNGFMETINLWTADKKNSNGMAFKIDLFDVRNGYNTSDYSGYMAFRTRAASGSTASAAYGHYTHTEISIVLGLTIGVGSSGLSVSGATSKTEMTDTGVSFSL